MHFSAEKDFLLRQLFPVHILHWSPTKKIRLWLHQYYGLLQVCCASTWAMLEQ